MFSTMAAHPQLPWLQLQALRPPNLVSVATGLQDVDVVRYEPFDSSPHAMWHTATSILRFASPWLERGLLLVTPFAILGYGVYNHIWRPIQISQLSTFIRSYFSAEVVVPTYHPIYNQVLDWMAKNSIGQTSHSIKLHSDTSSASRTAAYGSRYDFLGNMDEILDRVAPSSSSRTRSKSKAAQKSLSYVPTAQSTRFSFKGRTLWLRYDQARNASSKQHDHDDRGYGGAGLTGGDPDIKITCYNFFGGMKTIKKFLEHVHSENQIKMQSKLRIHRLSRNLGTPDYSGRNVTTIWDHNVITRPIRSLDMVSMDAEKKKGLIDDIEKYLSPSSQSWYTDRGIPWRRGYLFYGPPGTGKTSICSALAGHFNLDMYILSLSHPKLDDELLSQCFDHLPSRCLILIEDVDSAGVGREPTDKNDDAHGPDKRDDWRGQHIGHRRFASKQKHSVTLAGLLNTIDGPVSQEGRVLVMTTNSPDILDAALLRPGRVDRKVLFSNATHQVMKQIFMNTYDEVPSKKSTTSQPVNQDLQLLAEKFAANIPEDTLTPAEIQNYLMEHFGNPEAAVDGAEAWAERLVKTKQEGRNVEAFTGQIGNDEEQEVNGTSEDQTSSLHAQSSGNTAKMLSALKRMPNGFGNDTSLTNGAKDGIPDFSSLYAAFGDGEAGDLMNMTHDVVMGSG